MVLVVTVDELSSGAFVGSSDDLARVDAEVHVELRHDGRLMLSSSYNGYAHANLTADRDSAIREAHEIAAAAAALKARADVVGLCKEIHRISKE
jgi:hypothetical protein